MGAMPAALAGLLPKNFNPLGMMDSTMGCGSANAAEVRIKNGIPAWRYRYMGVWENTSLGPNTGAYHSGEIPIVFGTSELRSGHKPDSLEEAKVVKGKVHSSSSQNCNSQTLRHNEGMGFIRKGPAKGTTRSRLACL